MRLVFDAEANGLLNVPVWQSEANKMWCLVAVDIQSGKQHTLIEPTASELSTLLDQAEELIGHNITIYDLPLFKKLFGWEPAPWVKITDTLILSQLQRPDRPPPKQFNETQVKKVGTHSLAAWGIRVGIDKPEHDEWDCFSPAMLTRCETDVEINVLTHEWLLREQAADEEIGIDWTNAIYLEHKNSEIAAVQEQNGVDFDEQRARRLVKIFDEKIRRIDRKLHPLPLLCYIKDKVKPELREELGESRWYEDHHCHNTEGEYTSFICNWFGLDPLDAHDESPLIEFDHQGFCRVEFRPLELTSLDQIKRYLLNQGWIPTQFTKKGSPQLPKAGDDTEEAEKSLSTIKGETGKLIAQRLILSARRGFLLNLKDEQKGQLNLMRRDGRVTAGIVVQGTPTGRSRHRGVVNVPSPKAPWGEAIRRCYKAPEGRVIVGVDAMALEMRVMAHFLNDPDFTQAVLEGDPHQMFWDTVRDMVDSRGQTKNIEYAFIYGALDPKLGSMVDRRPPGVSIKQAGAEVRKRFMEGIPALGDLINRVQATAKHRGYLRGLDGRKLQPRSKHSLLNLLFQAAGAVIMKTATCYSDKWIREEELDSKLIITMHDEWQRDTLLSHAVRAGELCANAIVRAGEFYQLNCPMAGEAKIGANWAETH